MVRRVKSLYLPSPDISQQSGPEKLNEPTYRPATCPTYEPPQHEVAACLTFDPETALARVEGDHHLLRRMVGLFGMQWNCLCVEIANAGKQRDGARLELTASRLKLSVGSLGGARASRVAQNLEARGHRRDFHDIEKACARLQVEIERLLNALKGFSGLESNVGGLHMKDNESVQAVH
jgi:hypothetical protein